MNTKTSGNLTARWVDKIQELHPRMEVQMLKILGLIAANPDIAQKDLADRVGITLSSIGRNIDHLGPGGHRAKKGLGLVVRYEDPTDRRVTRFKLTKEGQKWWTEYCEVLEELCEKTRGKGSKAA